MFYQRLTILFFLCFLNLVFVLSDCSALDKYFYVQHKASTLVLTVRSSNVTLQRYDSGLTYYQQWRLVAAPRSGLFNIRRRGSLEGLDFNKDNYNIAIYDDTDSIYQQWFVNSDGSLVNAGRYGYGLTVNRTYFDQYNALFLALVESVGEEHIFELTEADNLQKLLL